jgi:transcriptional regulator with XRE-family HTH domain
MMNTVIRPRRTKIETRTKSLVAEELALTELRQAKALTQKKMAAVLGIGQEGVSRLEKRSDLLISALRDYVEAMGGRLHLIADFPDRPPVELAGLTAIDKVKTVAVTKRRTAAR